MIEPTNPVFLKLGDFSISGTSFEAEAEKPFISNSPFWIFMFVNHESFGSDWLNFVRRGSFAGYFLSILFMSLFFINLEFLFGHTNIEVTGKEFSLINFILILVISTASQFGDIIVSYFKRLSKIKDTGKIIPGHGGLLDRIDGMIFAFPTSYLIFKIFY